MNTHKIDDPSSKMSNGIIKTKDNEKNSEGL